MRWHALILAFLILGLGCSDDSRKKKKKPPDPCTDTAATLFRPADPVVLRGSDLPVSILGIDPLDLVAFRWTGAWEPIPVQVDERDTIDIVLVYGGVIPGSILVEDYTDPGTYAGVDTNPDLDADDEIVFMARDAGDRPCDALDPSGVLPGTGVELEIQDPLEGTTGWVYLFVQDGSLDPGAGQSYVTYTFGLLSGDYMTTYGFLGGPNPEDTTVSSSHYRRHFSDRWITDELNIYASGATGVDILDRHTNLFAPGNCQRSEDTFCDGEGAFVINKSGPVRALRSYIGANSGPLTQRTHLFYDRREDVSTYLRVHAISGVMDMYDYSPDATGMIYYTDLEPAGLTIDGIPDVIGGGNVAWELVTGMQGSITHVKVLDASFAMTGLTRYYLDDDSPTMTMCTGDAFAMGQSGYWLDMPIPNTDPLLLGTEHLTATRIIYYDGPGMSSLEASLHKDRAYQPPTVTAVDWP